MVELTGWIGGVHSQHRGTFAGHTGHRRWSQWCATAMRNIFGIMALSENWAKKINGFDGSFSQKKSSDFFLPKKTVQKNGFDGSSFSHHFPIDGSFWIIIIVEKPGADDPSGTSGHWHRWTRRCPELGEWWFLRLVILYDFMVNSGEWMVKNG